jgi:hypothetical protein
MQWRESMVGRKRITMSFVSLSISSTFTSEKGGAIPMHKELFRLFGRICFIYKEQSKMSDIKEIGYGNFVLHYERYGSKMKNRSFAFYHLDNPIVSLTLY